MEHQQSTEATNSFSGLSEDILILVLTCLPLNLAARASLLLAPCFQNLWKILPVVHLDLSAFKHLSYSVFVTVTKQIILNRDPTFSILDLGLHLYNCNQFENDISIPYMSSLLVKARSLGLRKLTLNLGYNICWPLLPLIFSFECLESLNLGLFYYDQPEILAPISLRNLKTLCINIKHSQLNCVIDQLVPQLDALEELHITSPREFTLHLKSITLRKLKLVGHFDDLSICTPSLELFELESHMKQPLEWNWEMPVLRKAVIQLKNVTRWKVRVISKILNTISHVEELHLDITEDMGELDPFSALVESNRQTPTLFSLKHFHLEICFHEYNLEDLLIVLQHCPALETLKLVHKPPYCRVQREKKKKYWKSMLLRNAEGNYRYNYFENLHIGDNKAELWRKMFRKLNLKRLKRNSNVLLNIN